MKFNEFVDSKAIYFSFLIFEDTSWPLASAKYKKCLLFTYLYKHLLNK